MKHGTQTKLAGLVGIKPQTLHDYLSGRSGASALVADQLAYLTGTNIRLWLQGGDPAERRAAVENVSVGEAENKNATRPPCRPRPLVRTAAGEKCNGASG